MICCHRETKPDREPEIRELWDSHLVTPMLVEEHFESTFIKGPSKPWDSG